MCCFVPHQRMPTVTRCAKMECICCLRRPLDDDACQAYEDISETVDKLRAQVRSLLSADACAS
jgi:hypothetical protein